MNIITILLTWYHGYYIKKKVRMSGITPDGLAACSPERTQHNITYKTRQDETR